MLIAITGATGHVGAALCRALLAGGHTLKVLYRAKLTGLDGLKVTAIQGDIWNTDSLDQLMEGAEIVFHLAAKISIEGDPNGIVWRTNVEGVEQVVQACQRAKVRRLIHVSSIHAHEQSPQDQVLDESRPYVSDMAYAYDCSKAAGERVVLQAVEDGLDAVILNPTAILGPFDFGTSYTGEMLRDLFRGKLPAIVKGGFDWVDVRDVAQAAIAAMEKGRTGEKYLLGGAWKSIAQIAEITQAVSGQRAPRLVTPIWLAKIGVPFAWAYAWLTGTRPLYTLESLNILQHSCRHISHEKATRELWFNPRPLEETIRDYYDWVKEKKIGMKHRNA